MSPRNDPEAGREFTYSAEAHTFRCDLCGKKRREEDRREPESEICRQCDEEAGFYS